MNDPALLITNGLDKFEMLTKKIPFSPEPTTMKLLFLLLNSSESESPYNYNLEIIFGVLILVIFRKKIPSKEFPTNKTLGYNGCMQPILRMFENYISPYCIHYTKVFKYNCMMLVNLNLEENVHHKFQELKYLLKSDTHH